MNLKVEGDQQIENTPEQERKQRFAWEITEYKSQVPRIIGIQKLKSLSLSTPDPMFVLNHSGFEEYKKSGMTQELKTQILKAYQEIRRTNPHRGVYVGRAYFVPGIEAPAGPRTAAIYDEESYLAETENFFKFAIKNGYDVPGANIALVLHPFIHAAEPLMVKDPPLEYPGGDLIPLPYMPYRRGILIRATFGPDEAVQGFPHDEYRVEEYSEEYRYKEYKGRREEVTTISITVAQKTETLFPREGRVYERGPIPPQFQTEQALSNIQIVKLAESYKLIEEAFGPHRLEFIAQPEGIIFRECLPFNVTPETLFPPKKGEIVGVVTRIVSERDIEKIQPPMAITFLTPEVFQRRDVNLFALLANHAKERKINLVVLSHGSIATSHLVRVFTDLGYPVTFVGKENYTEGEKVRIFKEGGVSRIERLK